MLERNYLQSESYADFPTSGVLMRDFCRQRSKFDFQILHDHRCSTTSILLVSISINITFRHFHKEERSGLSIPPQNYAKQSNTDFLRIMIECCTKQMLFFECTHGTTTFYKIMDITPLLDDTHELGWVILDWNLLEIPNSLNVRLWYIVLDPAWQGNSDIQIACKRYIIINKNWLVSSVNAGQARLLCHSVSWLI